MSITAHIRTFLKSVEHAIPPDPGCHHSLAYSNADGDGEQLALSLRRGKHTDVIYLDDDDLDRPLHSLIADILSLARALPEEANNG